MSNIRSELREAALYFTGVINKHLDFAPLNKILYSLA
jgi:hypothetical protein